MLPAPRRCSNRIRNGDIDAIHADDLWPPVVSDGPFSEGEQILGGYYLVECATLDRATQIAARFRESAFAAVEIRRLSGETSWDTGGPSGRSS
jgi:hypothetical protein